MVIQYDEYTKNEAEKFISNRILYSKLDNRIGFKPKDLRYIDLRRPMLMCFYDRKTLREVK